MIADDPYPWTWEIPLVTVLAILVLIIFGAHLGRAIANGLRVRTGGFRIGWICSAACQLFCAGTPRQVWLILTGRSHRRPPFSCVVATELILLAVTVLLLKWGLDRWGPGRMRGVATAGEAERLLGVTRLRRNRRIVRPDLYRNRHGAPR